MAPKDNFLNAQPSIATNDEASRAKDLASTDEELETTAENSPAFVPKTKEFVNRVNDAGEMETTDAGLDEEA